jgi:uncharacterized protein HemX
MQISPEWVIPIVIGLAVAIIGVLIGIAAGAGNQAENRRWTQELAIRRQQVVALERQLSETRTWLQALRQRLVGVQETLDQLHTQRSTDIGRLRLGINGELIEEP